MVKALAVVLAGAILVLAANAPPVPGLTAAPALARVYDAILDARFDDVPALLDAACPPAPAEACLALDAVAVWWRIQLDPFNTARDAQFELRVNAAITATAAWTLREPERAEAWPRTPHFWQAAAQIEDVYFHDVRASLSTWKALLDAAQTEQVAEASMAETAARLGMALQLDRLSRHGAALEHLHAVIAAQPAAPFAASARAHYQRGQVLERIGRQAEAAAAYRTAIAHAGPDDPLRIGADARQSLRALRRRGREEVDD